MLNSENNIRGEEEELLTISRLAAVMGVDRSWASRKVNSGEIPSISVGSQRRVPRWALKEWQQGETKRVLALAGDLV
jgi:excisionase family DNA binding protein